ncbi:hypothetical protein HDU76_007494, partial [Blyttiomyces sp. JEL0837]
NIRLWKSLFTRLYPSTLPTTLRYPQRFLGLSYKSAVLYKHQSNERKAWAGLSNPACERIVVTHYRTSTAAASTGSSSSSAAFDAPPLGSAPFQHYDILALAPDSLVWAPDINEGYACFAFLSRLRNSGGLAGVQNGDYVELACDARITGCSISDKFLVLSTPREFLVYTKGNADPDMIIPFDYYNDMDDETRSNATESNLPHRQEDDVLAPSSWIFVKDVLVAVWKNVAVARDPDLACTTPVHNIAVWDLAVMSMPPDEIVSVCSFGKGWKPAVFSDDDDYDNGGSNLQYPNYTNFDVFESPDLVNISVTRDSKGKLSRVLILCTTLATSSSSQSGSGVGAGANGFGAGRPASSIPTSPTSNNSTSSNKPIAVLHELSGSLEPAIRPRRTRSQLSKILWASVHGGGRMILFVGAGSAVESRWVDTVDHRSLAHSHGTGAQARRSGRNRDDYPIFNIVPINVGLGQIYDVHVTRFSAAILTDCIVQPNPTQPINMLYTRMSSPRLRVIDILTGESLTSFRYAATHSTPANRGLVRMGEQGIWWIADNAEIRYRPFRSQTYIPTNVLSRTGSGASISGGIGASMAGSGSVGFNAGSNGFVVGSVGSGVSSGSSISSTSASGSYDPSKDGASVGTSPSSSIVRRLHARTIAKPPPPNLSGSDYKIRIGGGGGVGNSGKARTLKEWKLRMAHRKDRSSKVGVRPVIGIFGFDEEEIRDTTSLGAKSGITVTKMRSVVLGDEDEEDENEVGRFGSRVRDSPSAVSFGWERFVLPGGDDENDDGDEEFEMYGGVGVGIGVGSVTGNGKETFGRHGRRRKGGGVARAWEPGMEVDDGYNDSDEDYDFPALRPFKNLSLSEDYQTVEEMWDWGDITVRMGELFPDVHPLQIRRALDATDGDPEASATLLLLDREARGGREVEPKEEMCDDSGRLRNRDEQNGCGFEDDGEDPEDSVNVRSLGHLELDEDFDNRRENKVDGGASENEDEDEDGDDGDDQAEMHATDKEFQLLAMFPSLASDFIRDTLNACDGDIDEAVMVLLDYSK